MTTLSSNHRFATETWTEEELLARMLMKQGLAWREFHRRYDRLVYRCIHKVTGRFSTVVSAEDIREIFAMFLMNLTARDMHRLRSFDAERGNKLSSWIGLLATNTAWDYLRTVARQPQCADLTEADDMRGSDEDPCQLLMHKQRWELVNATLESFSSKDRRFVHLYYVDGLTPEEVAEKMQISVKTVYSKKHKIRCRLERALAPAVEMDMPPMAA
jgi:RNA polymerase sigma-70 factor (ECF subfamily)